MTGTTRAGGSGARPALVAAAVVVAVVVLLVAALFVIVRRRAHLPPSIYGKTESTEAPETRTVAPAATALVTIFGATGTFGDAARSSSRPAVVAVDGWSFEPGASAFFSGMTPNGRVLIGTVPQTDNQAAPTGRSMSVGVFDPAASGGPSFRSLRIPTSGGVEETTSVGSDVGGADVSDLCRVTTSQGPRVMGISSVPYKFWDLDQGEFPALVSFIDDARHQGADAVAIDKARTKPPEDLRDSDAGRAALPVGAADGGSLPSAPGFTECDPLPGGGLAVTQYFPAAGHHAGGLVVLDGDGNTVAFHQIDDVKLAADLTVSSDNTSVRVPAGTMLTVSPREVRTDPSRTDPQDQRFVVIYDVGADVSAGVTAGVGTSNGGSAPGSNGHVRMPEMFQELRYDASSRTITPMSKLLVLRDEHPVGAPATDLVYAFTAAYAPDGTLFLTRTHAGSLLSAATAVFRPGSLSSRTTTDAPLGAEVTADALLTAFDGTTVRSPSGQNDFGATFSVTFDRTHGTLVQVSAGNALLRAVRWPGWDASGSTDGPTPAAAADASLCQVDLGGKALSDANHEYRYQARQGVTDPGDHALFLAYQGLQNGDPRPNLRIPQFLFEVDLDRLASGCGSTGRSEP